MTSLLTSFTLKYVFVLKVFWDVLVCNHSDLHLEPPVWLVVKSCLPHSDPSLPVPKQKLCSCCTGTRDDCCTDLSSNNLPNVSLSPPKLWHWLNKQVMIWRSRVKERLTEKSVCVYERKWETRIKKIIRVDVCEGVSKPCGNSDWCFTHPLSSPPHPVYTFAPSSCFLACCFNF